MGRRVQKLDSIANTIYVLVTLQMVAAALLCLIQGTLRHIWLIAAGGALFYLVNGISEFIRQEEGYVKRGIFKFVLTLLLVGFAYIAKVCL